MAKKKKTGLGRGLDSLIPVFPDDDESEENSSLTLEDMLKEKDEEDKGSKKSKEKKNNEKSNSKEIDAKGSKNTGGTEKTDVEEVKNIYNEIGTEKLSTSELLGDETETKTQTEPFQIPKETDQKVSEVSKKASQQVSKTPDTEFNQQISEVATEEAGRQVSGVATEEAGQQISEVATEEVGQQVSGVVSKKTDQKASKTIKATDTEKNIKTPIETSQPVPINEEVVEVAKASETELATPKESEKTVEDIMDNLTEREKQSIDEVVKIIDKNPRITLWSAKSAAVFRYLRKTEPEFSISKEASKLIDEAVQTKYPEIWVLFKDIEK